MHRKSGEVRPSGSRDKRGDRQTNRQTGILIKILCTPPGGEVKTRTQRHHLKDTAVPAALFEKQGRLGYRK